MAYSNKTLIGTDFSDYLGLNSSYGRSDYTPVDCKSSYVQVQGAYGLIGSKYVHARTTSIVDISTFGTMTIKGSLSKASGDSYGTITAYVTFAKSSGGSISGNPSGVTFTLGSITGSTYSGTIDTTVNLSSVKSSQGDSVYIFITCVYSGSWWAYFRSSNLTLVVDPSIKPRAQCLIGGTWYGIDSGKTKIGGTARDIMAGFTKVSGTKYNIFGALSYEKNFEFTDSSDINAFGVALLPSGASLSIVDGAVRFKTTVTDKYAQMALANGSFASIKPYSVEVRFKMNGRSGFMNPNLRLEYTNSSGQNCRLRYYPYLYGGSWASYIPGGSQNNNASGFTNVVIGSSEGALVGKGSLLSLNAWHTIKVECGDGVLKAFVDGTQQNIGTIDASGKKFTTVFLDMHASWWQTEWTMDVDYVHLKYSN